MDNGRIQVVHSRTEIVQGCNLGPLCYSTAIVDLLRDFPRKPPLLLSVPSPHAKVYGHVQNSYSASLRAFSWSSGASSKRKRSPGPLRGTTLAPTSARFAGERDGVKVDSVLFVPKPNQSSPREWWFCSGLALHLNHSKTHLRRKLWMPAARLDTRRRLDRKPPVEATRGTPLAHATFDGAVTQTVPVSRLRSALVMPSDRQRHRSLSEVRRTLRSTLPTHQSL